MEKRKSKMNHEGAQEPQAARRQGKPSSDNVRRPQHHEPDGRGRRTRRRGRRTCPQQEAYNARRKSTTPKENIVKQSHYAQRKPPEDGSGQQQPQTLATTENRTPVVGPYKAWCSSRSVGLEVRALLFTWLIRYYAQSGRKQQRFPFTLPLRAAL